MKWKLIIPTLLACGGIALWLNAGNNGEDSYTTREIPVAGPQQKEVLQLTRELVNLYNEQGTSSLERIFVHSRNKRIMMKTETGSDPVESSLAVLKKNGSRLTLQDPEVKCLSNAGHKFIVSCKLKQNGSSILIYMQKTSRGYGLSEIKEL
mgnify:FL=1